MNYYEIWQKIAFFVLSIVPILLINLRCRFFLSLARA